MGVNKVILVGNLGRDPEIRQTANGVPVANFSIATSEKWKDASGQWVDHTEWHTIVAFGKRAEFCSNYLKKGKQIYVEGKMRTRKWQDKEGKDRYTTEVVADNFQFVGRKGEDGGDYAAGPVPEPAQALPTADSLAPSIDEVTFEDDDIPF